MGIWYLLPDIELTQTQYYAELDLKLLTILFVSIWNTKISLSTGIWYLLPDIEFTQPQYYAELDLKL